MPTYTPEFLQKLAGTPAAKTLETGKAAPQVRAAPPQAVSAPLGQVPMENLSGLSGSALYEKKLLIGKQKQDSELMTLSQQNQAADARDAEAARSAKDRLTQLQQWLVAGGVNGVTAEDVAHAAGDYTKAVAAQQTNHDQRNQALTQKKTQNDTLYQQASGAVKRMKAIETGNSDLDSQNATAKDEYGRQVSGYDDSVKKYQDYQKQKIDYEQAAAQREADISAGKYNVDPYRFIHQGASLPEILELRKQMNSGVAKPLMRVPTAPTAPTEVQAPGERPADFVAREHMGYEPIADDVSNFLGYTPPPPPPAPASAPAPAPAPAPAAVPPAPAPAVEQKPAVEAKPAEPAKPAAPAPAPLTTQTTASQSSNPTQQTVTQPVQQQEPINKATSLEQQTSGTVAGQASSATSQKPAPQPTPQNVAAPAPFKPDDEKKDENVWEI